MTAAGFRKMVARTGELGKFPFPVHPHMLRHACGYKLANDGQDTRAVQHYLGHKNSHSSSRGCCETGGICYDVVDGVGCSLSCSLRITDAG